MYIDRLMLSLKTLSQSESRKYSMLFRFGLSPLPSQLFFHIPSQVSCYLVFWKRMCFGKSGMCEAAGDVFLKNKGINKEV